MAGKINFTNLSIWRIVLAGIAVFLFIWKYSGIWPWLCLSGIGAGWYWYLSKKRPAGKHIELYLLFSALAAALCFGEIAVRCSGKNICYKEKNTGFLYRVAFTNYTSPFTYFGQMLTYAPNRKDCGIHNSEFDYVKPANSLGFVDSEWHRQKTKTRFIFFGDSFTEGVGAPPDSSYVACFRKLAHDSIEMYNAGISGSDPCSQYMLLKQMVLDNYRPDRVYVAINQSDIYDVMTYGGLERFAADGEVHLKKQPWWEKIYAHSFLFRLIIHQFLGLNRQFYNSRQAGIETGTAIRKIETCIDSFATLTQQKGIRCIFIFHPMPYEVASKKMEISTVLLYARNKHYDTINMLDEFLNNGADSGNIQKYFWAIDGHNNSKGYQLIARGLLKTL